MSRHAVSNQILVRCTPIRRSDLRIYIYVGSKGGIVSEIAAVSVVLRSSKTYCLALMVVSTPIISVAGVLGLST